ncbi:hypothetical protein [Natrinema longum]|uniref:RCK C-terminal domain-containing protein n=1 Tax=Natrinema longum TaxID=370324 RepID=A0A8A2UA18_9EURY|nr:hypothetical protein [Natrinema longum]MBZ6493612.1 hypothetical protein [Natrinema longum]QSW85045.1 hypothetical protein J0X27_16605 [Natrinema longum]
MMDVGTLWDLVRTAAIDVVGMALLAGIVGLLAAAGYRWATTRSPPAGAAVLLGLSTVAGHLTYTVLGANVFFDGIPLDHQFSAGYLLATFLLAGIVAAGGSRLGDRLSCQVADLSRIDASGEPAAAIRSAGLAVALELPEAIAEAEGYRSVDPSVRQALSEATMTLPHGLSTPERRDRIERRVERDYDVGFVDVTMADDGTIDRVLVGRRSAGLGSMLPPKTAGIAIRAECSPAASLGDPVEIRSTGDRDRLIATGTLRTATGSVATVLVDVDRVDDFAVDERYRLVTRPDEPTDGYEFASTLRTVDETVTTLSIDSDGRFAGEFVGWLPGRVLVLDRADELRPFPEDSETLRAGDDLWILAPPEDLTMVDPADSTNSHSDLDDQTQTRT